MVTFELLNQQNHKITELSNVLSYLIADRAMCDTETTCSLFFNYVTKVEEHLDLEESLYSKLLVHHDYHTKLTAERFLSGSQEIKKIFANYVKSWCRSRTKELKIGDHDLFVRDTLNMFQLVLDRIQAETEQLYPLIREVTGDSRNAA